MDDFYKTRYENTYKKLQVSEKEARFYRNLSWFICGMTNASLSIIFFGGVGWFTTTILANWSNLSISDKVSLALLVFAVCGGIIRYGRIVLNWPEELYLYSLKKEKEVEELQR